MKRWLRTGQLAPGARVAGFTMTEVLIVLAATTVLFAVVAVTFQGRQARTEFTQAVRDYEAKLNNIVSDVHNGRYPSVNCAATGVGGSPTVGGASNIPGSCIFFGKTMAPSGTSSRILTAVGRRTVGNPPRDVTTFDEAAPVSAPDPEIYNHPFGLRVVKMINLTDDSRVIILGFDYPLGSDSPEEASGNRLVTLHGVESLTSPRIQLSDGVKICLAGQNGQRAEVSIGAANNQSIVTSELDTPNEGVCREV